MRKYLPKIIRVAKQVALGTSVIAIAFVIGTFTPNQYAVHKVTEESRIYHSNWAQALGLHEPSMTYKTDKEFVKELYKCVDFLNFVTEPDKRVPLDMLTGQAVLESAWGQSRFATEAHNLFGIRTFDENGSYLLPQGVKKWPGWGVRKFETKCASVREYIRLLNEHSAYEDFRVLRASQYAKSGELDGKALIKTLKSFSTTPDYSERVIRIMEKVNEVMEKK